MACILSRVERSSVPCPSNKSADARSNISDRGSVGISISFLVLISTLAAATARTDEKKDRARDKFEEAVALFGGEDYDAAILRFEQSYMLSQKSVTLFNIAMCYVALSRNAMAIGAFRRFLAEGGEDIDQAKANEAAEMIEQLMTRLGTLRIEQLPEGAIVEIDGTHVNRSAVLRPILMESGDHYLRVSTNGDLVHESQIVIAPGVEKIVHVDVLRTEEHQPSLKNLNLMLREERPPVAVETPEAESSEQSKTSRLFISGLCAGGLGFVGLGLGGHFTYQQKVHLDEIEPYREQYEETGDPKDAQTYIGKQAELNNGALKRDHIGMALGYAVGGTLLATGIVIMIVDMSTKRHRSEDDVSISYNINSLEARF